jgi:hypothetical protein
MRILLIVILAMGIGACKKHPGSGGKASCRLQARMEYPKCDNFDLLDRVRGSNLLDGVRYLYDACGEKALYEYGQWCEDCSYTCRRVKKP